MNKKLHPAVSILFDVLLSIVFVFGGNILLTNLIDSSNIVCKGQKFSSVEEAIQAMETSERKSNSTSLDFCPPYEAVYTFEYDKNTIVFFSYCDTFDGEKSDSYAIRILKHNNDGTLSFDNGFASFYLGEQEEYKNHYDCTNIKTSKGTKSICFTYLEKESTEDIYIDGIKAEKQLVSIEGREFYICYAISRRDTFLSNLFTLFSDRHKVEVK